METLKSFSIRRHSKLLSDNVCRTRVPSSHFSGSVAPLQAAQAALFSTISSVTWSLLKTCGTVAIAAPGHPTTSRLAPLSWERTGSRIQWVMDSLLRGRMQTTLQTLQVALWLAIPASHFGSILLGLSHLFHPSGNRCIDFTLLIPAISISRQLSWVLLATSVSSTLYTNSSDFTHGYLGKDDSFKFTPDQPRLYTSSDPEILLIYTPFSSVYWRPIPFCISCYLLLNP